MSRPLLFLMLLLLLAAIALPGSYFSGHSATATQLSLPQEAPRQAGQMEQAWAAGMDSMNRHAVAGNGPAAMGSDCDAAQVCVHPALLAGPSMASSTWVLPRTWPEHSAQAWLSADHAPDFRPPIL